MALDVPLDIECVDVTQDVALSDRYGLRIPVLGEGARELDLAGLDDRQLTAWLRA